LSYTRLRLFEHNQNILPFVKTSVKQKIKQNFKLND